jgi:LemA protein
MISINTIITIALLTVLLTVLISGYNRLNRRRNQIENAKSSLDALFIKRHDLIPNLITVTQTYADYERETLDKIIQLRQSVHLDGEYQQDNELSALVKRLMVQVENYPELKASQQFTNLQYSWNEVEEQIAAGRRYLSASVTQYNDTVRVFPSNLIARFFGFSVHEWERASEEQRESPSAKELFEKK